MPNYFSNITRAMERYSQVGECCISGLVTLTVIEVSTESLQQRPKGSPRELHNIMLRGESVHDGITFIFSFSLLFLPPAKK